MKKKVVLLLVLAALVVVPVFAQSDADFKVVQIEDGSVAITGYHGTSTNVVIPPTYSGIKITTIGYNAFAGKPIVSLEIPDTVTIIGEDAFKGCELTSVKLGNGVKKIHNGAFGGNGRLQSIVIPDSVTVIGMSAFEGCGLTNLVLGKNVTIIQRGAFRNNLLANVSIPPSVKAIYHEAFANNKIRAVTIPNGVTALSHLTDEDDSGMHTGAGGPFWDNPVSVLSIPPSLAQVKVKDYMIYQIPFTGFYRAFNSTADFSHVALPANVDDINLHNNNFPASLINFYKSQGRKAGVYKKTGQLWVSASQEEFNSALQAAKEEAERDVARYLSRPRYELAPSNSMGK
jgi:hypothetical protein